MKQLVIVVVFGIGMLITNAQEATRGNFIENGKEATTNENLRNKSNLSSATNKELSLVLRSTVGMNGLLKSISTDAGTFIVSQSIGQASVIGTYTKNDYTVIQGFQQPLNSAGIGKQASENLLRATVYPNPFDESVNVEIHEKISNAIHLIVTDPNGRVVYTKIYPASQSLSASLQYLAAGIYILQVSAEGKQLIVKLIKH